jgi:hypothetical protein
VATERPEGGNVARLVLLPILLCLAASGCKEIVCTLDEPCQDAPERSPTEPGPEDDASAPPFGGDEGEWIVSTVSTAPVAVARWRAADPWDPEAPFTDPAAIAPLDTVYFDGSASFDPRGAEPFEYRWILVNRPAGSSTIPQPSGWSPHPFAQMFVDMASAETPYTVLLEVRNSLGHISGETEVATIHFHAHCPGGMSIQLVWDHPTSDLDLHVVNLDGSVGTLGSIDDCYAADPPPPGCGGSVSGAEDDTEGLGPESLMLSPPAAGTARIYVHVVRADEGASLATVRVGLDGGLAFESSRALEHTDDVWIVADVEWPARSITPIGDLTTMEELAP